MQGSCKMNTSCSILKKVGGQAWWAHVAPVAPVWLTTPHRISTLPLAHHSAQTPVTLSCCSLCVECLLFVPLAKSYLLPKTQFQRPFIGSSFSTCPRSALPAVGPAVLNPNTLWSSVFSVCLFSSSQRQILKYVS